MVLLQRPDGSSAQAGPSSLRLTGGLKGDNVKFVILFQVTAAHSVNETDMSYKMLDLINGQALQFF